MSTSLRIKPIHYPILVSPLSMPPYFHSFQLGEVVYKSINNFFFFYGKITGVATVAGPGLLNTILVISTELKM